MKHIDHGSIGYGFAWDWEERVGLAVDYDEGREAGLCTEVHPHGQSCAGVHDSRRIARTKAFRERNPERADRELHEFCESPKLYIMPWFLMARRPGARDPQSSCHGCFYSHADLEPCEFTYRADPPVIPQSNVNNAVYSEGVQHDPTTPDKRVTPAGPGDGPMARRKRPPIRAWFPDQESEGPATQSAG